MFKYNDLNDCSNQAQELFGCSNKDRNYGLMVGRPSHARIKGTVGSSSQVPVSRIIEKTSLVGSKDPQHSSKSYNSVTVHEFNFVFIAKSSEALRARK